MKAVAALLLATLATLAMLARPAGALCDPGVISPLVLTHPADPARSS